MNSNIMGLSPLFLISNDIVELSKSCHVFHFSHVRRVGNTIAHLVARWDTQRSSQLVCMNHFPQSIITLSELDLQ